MSRPPLPPFSEECRLAFNYENAFLGFSGTYTSS